MKSARNLTVVAVLLLLTAGSKSFAAASAATKENPAPSAETDKPAKPTLQKGMDAAEVIKLIGKPTEIKQLSAADGKAERWIYRRLLSRTVQQSATGVRDVPGFDGAVGHVTGSRSEIVYSNVYVETYQVTHLLMFNDQLVVAKQWNEQTKSFN